MARVTFFSFFPPTLLHTMTKKPLLCSLLLLLAVLAVAGATSPGVELDYSKLSGIIIPGFASTQLRAWSILDCPYSPLDFNPLDLVWLDTTKVHVSFVFILMFLIRSFALHCMRIGYYGFLLPIKENQNEFSFPVIVFLLLFSTVVSILIDSIRYDVCCML